VEKRVVVVTGASRGNGLAISKLLSEDPNSLIIGVDLDECVVNEETIFSQYLRLDVSNPDASKVVFDLASQLSSDICLVNNAGVTKPNNLPYPLEDFDFTLKINLRAPFVWMEEFRKLVDKNEIKTGAIVNICSLAAHRAFPNNPSYIASKHGLLGLTKYYASALGSYQIRVNSVSPGYIRTEMTLRSFKDESRREQIGNHSMMGRWGETSEIAKVVRFLLSEESSFITGSDIPIDGGWLSNGMYFRQ